MRRTWKHIYLAVLSILGLLFSAGYSSQKQYTSSTAPPNESTAYYLFVHILMHNNFWLNTCVDKETHYYILFTHTHTHTHTHTVAYSFIHLILLHLTLATRTLLWEPNYPLITCLTYLLTYHPTCLSIYQPKQSHIYIIHHKWPNILPISQCYTSGFNTHTH